MKLGAARDQSRTAWRLAVIEVAADCATFSYRLDRDKLRQARAREGRYLLRTNLVEEDPAKHVSKRHPHPVVGVGQEGVADTVAVLERKILPLRPSEGRLGLWSPDAATAGVRAV